MKVITATLESVGSHTTSNRQGGDRVDHEEVYFYFSSEWRGQACKLTVAAKRDRYREEDWQTWRVFAEGEAHAVDEEGRRISPLSDTARSRLAAVCIPIAEEWITGPDYATSRRRAYAWYVTQAFDDRYGMRRVRRALDLYAAELSAEDLERFTRAADAYAEYRRIMTGSEDE